MEVLSHNSHAPRRKSFMNRVRSLKSVVAAAETEDFSESSEISEIPSESTRSSRQDSPRSSVRRSVRRLLSNKKLNAKEEEEEDESLRFDASPVQKPRPKLGRFLSKNRVEDTDKKSSDAKSVASKAKTTMTKREMVKTLQTYSWYARLAQPTRVHFKKRVKAMEHCDITEDDVDLLPWIMNGTLVNIAKMNKIIAAASKVLDKRKR